MDELIRFAAGDVVVVTGDRSAGYGRTALVTHPFEGAPSALVATWGFLPNQSLFFPAGNLRATGERKPVNPLLGSGVGNFSVELLVRRWFRSDELYEVTDHEQWRVRPWSQGDPVAWRTRSTMPKGLRKKWVALMDGIGSPVTGSDTEG